MRHISRSRQAFRPQRAGMRGAVLAVVLIVLVVVMLGGAALMRSLDTSVMLAGNVAFKRDSINRAGPALDRAFAMFSEPAIASLAESAAGCSATTACTNTPTWIAANFWPRLLEADGSGVPEILKNKSRFDAKFTSTANRLSADGNEMRFLIERMCTDYGAADERKCSLTDNVQYGGGQPRDGQLTSALPLYRVTVRIDGPRNTLSYAQAIVTTKLP